MYMMRPVGVMLLVLTGCGGGGGPRDRSGRGTTDSGKRIRAGDQQPV